MTCRACVRRSAPAALAYRPGDAAALAACVDQLAEDTDLRHDLGIAAAVSARRHDIRATATHLRDLSNTVLEVRRV